MTSKTTKRFRDALAKLPKEIRRQAQESYQRFAQEPQHPSLRFKKVHATEPIFSARINIDYRAVGVVEGETIVWFWVGTHAAYEKLLSQI
jgi:hypothetical protein